MDQLPTVSTGPALQHASSRIPAQLIVKLLLGSLAVVGILVLLFGFLLPLVDRGKEKEVSVTYWGLEEEAIVRPVISEFSKKHARVKVTYVKQDLVQYRQRLTTRIEQGGGPDVFVFHNSWVSSLAPNLVPLPKDVVTSNEFAKTYYPVAAQDLVRQGGVFGIPVFLDTLSLFANTEMFKAAGVLVPTTWGEFVSTARLLSVKDETGKIKTAGAALGAFDNVTHAPEIVSLLFAQNGVDLRNLSQTRENASDALRFYTSFAIQGGVWDETLDQSLAVFTKGSLAMYFGFARDIVKIQQGNPSLSFEIHSVPHLPNRNQTIASYFVNGVSIKSKNKKEALLFLAFISKLETARALSPKLPFARVDLAQELKGKVLLFPFVAQASEAVSTVFVSETMDSNLNEQLNIYLGNAVKSILAGASAESAVDTLSQGVTQVLQQNQAL